MPIDFRASQVQTNKIIASGSTGTETGAQIVVYSHLADDGAAPNQGFIDQAVFNTGSIGTDIFLYVSGGIGQRLVGGAKSISVFGGDLHVSGNLTVGGSYPSGGGGGANFFFSETNKLIEASGSLEISGSGYFLGGLSGSLQQVAPGVPYLLAGPNITITTNSLGQVEISGSATSTTGSSFFRLEVVDYYSTNATSTTTAGQVIFPANQFTGSIVLQGVIANQLSTATGSIRLFNVSSGSYVEIGGAGITHLKVSGSTPTIVTSVNLISASNFNSSSQAIYELQVSSSNPGSYAFFGGFELRPFGSFTGISYVTASNNFYYVSGTWEDGGNKLATTSSVAVTGLQGPGFFADDVGSDVFFYVSGSSGSKDGGTPGVAVFGGDVVISGVLHGGSPLKISGSVLQGHQNSAIGLFSHAEGKNTTAFGDGSHSEGEQTLAYGKSSHVGGYFATGSGDYSHATGEYSKAGILGYSVVSIDLTQVPYAIYKISKDYPDVSGEFSEKIIGADASGVGPFGLYNFIGVNYDGDYTYVTASNDYNFPAYYGSFAISTVKNSYHAYSDQKIGGYAANAGGYRSIAIGLRSHSEGIDAKAIGNYSHAEGFDTLALGNYSHAEGIGTIAYGTGSHAEGNNTIAIESGSFAAGLLTIASGSGQAVFGTFNSQNNNTSLFVIGNGNKIVGRRDIFRANINNIEITGSLTVSGTNILDGTLNQYNGLRYYPTIVTSLPYTASPNDYIVAVSASGGIVKLPNSEFGRTFIVKDISGSAAASPIAVKGDGELIDGSPTATIAIDYGSAKFVYFGSGRGWGVI